jgi:predicted Rossmann fold nucleotide-binding protein DprA/Smf involved in DNA uptake
MHDPLLLPQVAVAGAHAATDPQRAIEPLLLTEEEGLVLGLLTPDAPAHIDQLLLSTGLTPSVMMSVLLALEMKDRIIQLPGKSFLRRL